MPILPEHANTPQQDITAQYLRMPFLRAINRLPESISLSTTAVALEYMGQTDGMAYSDFVQCELEGRAPGGNLAKSVDQTVHAHNKATINYGLPPMEHNRERLGDVLAFVFRLTRDRFLSSVEQLGFGDGAERLEKTPVPRDPHTADNAGDYLFRGGLSDKRREGVQRLLAASSEALDTPYARAVAESYRDVILPKRGSYLFPDASEDRRVQKMYAAEYLFPVVAFGLIRLDLPGITSSQRETFAYNITRPF